MSKKEMVAEALGLLNERAQYARNVVLGRQAMSGADLAGKARKYGSHYHAQREVALEAIEQAGGHVRIADHGRLEIVWAPVPEGAKKAKCNAGQAWKY